MQHSRPRLARLLAAAALPAALALAGCAGSSNNRSGATTPVTPGAFPAEIAYIGNAPIQDTVRSPHVTADNSVPSVQAYRISSGSSSSPVSVTLLSQSQTESGGQADDGVPEALALDPTRSYLFVVDNDDGNFVNVFQINADGSLPASPVASTFVGNGNSFAGDNAEITVAAPAGAPAGTEYAYVATTGDATGAVYGFRFNTATHTLVGFTPGSATSDMPYSLATDTTGTHLYSGGGVNHPVVTPYVISAADGTLTAETQQEAGTSGPVVVTNDPVTSSVFAYDEGARILYSYSTAGGTLAEGNEVTTSATGNDLAIAPDGSALYLSNGTAGTITGSAIGSGGSLGAAATTSALSDTNLIGVTVDSSSRFVVSLDEFSDSVVAFPITSPGSLGAPTATSLDGSNPIAAIFVPVTTQTVQARH